MQHGLLSPTQQRLALSPIPSPSSETVFHQQANVLLHLGLSTKKEINSAAEHVPESQSFLFIPTARPAVERMVEYITSLYGDITGRVDLKHPVRDLVKVPEGPYFLTFYDESVWVGKVSAINCESTCRSQGRSPLTAVELGFRLLYFREGFPEKQFAAAGSWIDRDGKERHTPVFFAPDGDTEKLLLGSFLQEHSSGHTLFPSCEGRVRI